MFFRSALGVCLAFLLAVGANAQAVGGGGGGVGTSVFPTIVDNVAALRTTNLTGKGNDITLTSYYTGGLTGGGPLQLVGSDTTSTDNGCTIFVDSAGNRWYRQIGPAGLGVDQCGAKGDGTTDDTTKVQAAINLACANPNTAAFPITIPPSFTLGITAALSFKGCYSLVFGGTTGVSSSTHTPQIKWIGTAGAGPMLSVNQTDTGTFHHFVLSDHVATPVDVVIEDTETGSITTTNTTNQFDDIYIAGPITADGNFVGIRIGQGDVVGNADIGRFDKITINCGGAAPTTNTSNGVGFRFVSSSAEPFVDRITNYTIVGCSRGIDVEGQISVLVMDGGNNTVNYTDLYVTGGENILFENLRSENAIGPPVDIEGGNNVTLFNDTLAGVCATCTGIVDNIQGNGELIIDTVNVEGSSGFTFMTNAAGGSTQTTIRNSQFPTGGCPTFGGWAGTIVSTNNYPNSGSKCANTMSNTSFTVGSWIVAQLPSGTDVHTGEIALVTDANASCSAGTVPTGGGTHKCFVGYGGTSWTENGSGN